MRFFTGLIVGIVLTIGTAFIVDSFHSAPGPDDKSAQRMVNWAVVSDNLKGLSSDVQDGWAKLVGETRPAEKKTGA